MGLSNQDLAILGVVALLGGAYLLYGNSKKPVEAATSAFVNGKVSGTATPDISYGRDFVLAMEKAVSTLF